MAQHIQKKSRPGVGICGTPDCKRPRAKDRYVCAKHARVMDRIRDELENDPKLLYHRRSDNPKRQMQSESREVKPKSKLAICKAVGCFEQVARGETYCFDHMDMTTGDD